MLLKNDEYSSLHSKKLFCVPHSNEEHVVYFFKNVTESQGRTFHFKFQFTVFDIFIIRCSTIDIQNKSARIRLIQIFNKSNQIHSCGYFNCITNYTTRTIWFEHLFIATIKTIQFTMNQLCQNASGVHTERQPMTEYTLLVKCVYFKQVTPRIPSF